MFTKGALELLFVLPVSTDIPLSDMAGLCELREHRPSIVDLLRPIGIALGGIFAKLWKLNSPMVPGVDTGGMFIKSFCTGGIIVVSGLRIPECKLKPSFSNEECNEESGLSGSYKKTI